MIFSAVRAWMPYTCRSKANEFIGTSQLPTFICNDVIKNPQVEQYIVNYIAHLEKVFGPA